MSAHPDTSSRAGDGGSRRRDNRHSSVASDGASSGEPRRAAGRPTPPAPRVGEGNGVNRPLPPLPAGLEYRLSAANVVVVCRASEPQWNVAAAAPAAAASAAEAVASAPPSAAVSQGAPAPLQQRHQQRQPRIARGAGGGGGGGGGGGAEPPRSANAAAAAAVAPAPPALPKGEAKKVCVRHLAPMFDLSIVVDVMIAGTKPRSALRNGTSLFTRMDADGHSLMVIRAEKRASFVVQWCRANAASPAQTLTTSRFDAE